MKRREFLLGSLGAALSIATTDKNTGEAKPEDDNEYKLCYVEGGQAYFTTLSLTGPGCRQWGDDWNDAPYQHNAGYPYKWHPYDAERGIEPYKLLVAWYAGPLDTPDKAFWRKAYSVEEINQKVCPWLQSGWGAKENVRIWAAASPEKFAELVTKAGGVVGKLEEATWNT